MIKKFFNFFKKLAPFYLFIVLILINYLLNVFNLRLDLSTGSAYSLSSSSKNILKKIDKSIEIIFYVSSDLPSRLIPLKNEVKDFLKEYEVYSKKIKLKILDPKNDSKALEEVQKFGIPELQYSQLEQDSYQVKKVYFGIVIKYQDKTETIKQVNDISNLEYNLTSLVYKLTKKTEEKIAVIGKKEIFNFNNEQTDDLSLLKELLRNQYSLDFIDISDDSSSKEISQDYKLILIFDNNEKKYTDEEIEKIDNYLKKNGKAMFFINGVWVNEINLFGQKADHNLFNLLKKYGVKINEDMVLSLVSELVNFGSKNYQILTNYPYWIKTNNFNKDYNFFSNINFLTFPWGSSIDLEKNGKYKNETLVYSVNESWRKAFSANSTFLLNPENINSPQKKDLIKSSLVVQVKDKNQLKIVVFSSSRFVNDQFISQNNNLNFVFNLISDMVSSGALSGIRQREVNFYVLPSMSNNFKNIAKFILIFLLPVIFIFFGLIRIIKRSSKE